MPGWQRPELAVVGKGRLSPRLHDDLEGFFEVCPIALLILNGRTVAPAPRLRLPRLVAAADAELQPPAADHVEHCRLLRDAQGMPPWQDVRHLTEANAFRLRRDGGFG